MFYQAGPVWLATLVYHVHGDLAKLTSFFKKGLGFGLQDTEVGYLSKSLF